MSELSIQILAENTTQQLRKIGLSEATVSFYQNESFKMIIRFFEQRGVLSYSPNIMSEYLAFEYSRFLEGEIGIKRLRARELGANRLMCVANGQELEWKLKSRGVQIPLLSYFQVLHSIDTSEAVGKRDYAMLLLAIKTGLRTIDISRLHLSNIHWEQGEVSIIQQKTLHPLTLPLDSTMMNALADYILNGRQQTSSDCVFLREHAPFQGFHDGHAVAHMFRRRLQAAGLKKINGDGKSIHALRRTLGTAMAKADVPITTISQVLGHRSLDSTKRYISLENKHLKRCALTLSGIEISRKELLRNV